MKKVPSKGGYGKLDLDVDPAWKKAAIMLWKQIADHKYASIFMNPVKDEHAKSYSTVIKGIFYLTTTMSKKSVKISDIN